MDDVGFVDYYDEGVKVGGKRDKGGEKREGTQMRLRHKLNKVKKIEKNNKYLHTERPRIFFFLMRGRWEFFCTFYLILKVLPILSLTIISPQTN